MPATSQAQQAAAGADLDRVRAGKSPRTFKGASEETIRHFASTKRKGLPARASKSKRRQRIAQIRSGG